MLSLKIVLALQKNTYLRHVYNYIRQDGKFKQTSN